MKLKFKKGDIVRYDCSRERFMKCYRHLNGSIGIIIADTPRRERQGDFWPVNWLVPISGDRTEESRKRSKTTGVLHRDLHKIGECDWDEIAKRTGGAV